MIPLFIWNFIVCFQKFRYQLKREDIPETAKWDFSMGITKSKLVITGMTVLYCAIMPRIGFIVTTVVYMAAMTVFLGERKPIKIGLYVIITVGLLYYIFAIWLRIRMPNGLLI